MPRMRKPLDIGKSLIPLSEPQAVLMVVANVPRVLYGSRQLLVEEKVLIVLRADNFIYPFSVIDPTYNILRTTITPEGREEARKRIESAGGFKQLYFDELTNDGQGSGDATGSAIMY